MAQPQQSGGTTPTVAPDAAHESTHWHGGHGQEAGAWCFAAAAQTVQAGFGTAVTQAEIAHASLMAVGATNHNPQNAPNAVAYYTGVQNLWATFELNSTSWADIGAYVTADQTLNGYLRGSYGVPRFDGRTVTTGGRLTTDEIIATLDANGLVVKGNVNHFTVIYGYRRQSGNVTFHVYNPLTGASQWIADASVRADMGMSYRVTA